MLRSVEITAEVTGTAQGNVLHNLHWQQRLEIDLDCFWCERTARPTLFEWGDTAALCTAHTEDAQHRTSARLEHLTCAARAEQRLLRAVVGCWWSPFHDAVADAAAAPLDVASPVRLTLGYFCRRNHRSGVAVVGPDTPTPYTVTCAFCDVTMATLPTAPSVRMLD